MAHPRCATDAHAAMNRQASGLGTSDDAPASSIDQALLRRVIVRCHGCSRSA